MEERRKKTPEAKGRQLSSALTGDAERPRGVRAEKWLLGGGARAAWGSWAGTDHGSCRKKRGHEGKGVCRHSCETFVISCFIPQIGQLFTVGPGGSPAFSVRPGAVRPAAHLSEIGLFRLGWVCCLWGLPERREALVPKKGQPFRTAVWGERGPRTF